MRTSLTLRLAGGYALLIVYASLYPLTGWHDSGVDPAAFLAAAWPRYYTGFDLATNVAAYLPFGFLCTAGLRRRLPGAAAVASSILGGAALSLALEWTQNYLPNRVPSNLDLACNSIGMAAGAWLGVAFGPRWLDAGRLARWRSECLVAAAGSEAGLLLLAAWLLTQLSPETQAFGSGDLRRMLDLPAVQAFEPPGYIHVEAAIAAAGLLSAGLVTALLLRPERRMLALAALMLALLLRAAGHALMMGPGAALAWITPGVGLGLLAGLVLWWGSVRFLAGTALRALAALALLFATVLVNIAPENPYLLNTLHVWNPGQFLNFNGLTRLVASLWPFLALPWLMSFRPENTHAPDR